MNPLVSDQWDPSIPRYLFKPSLNCADPRLADLFVSVFQVDQSRATSWAKHSNSKSTLFEFCSAVAKVSRPTFDHLQSGMANDMVFSCCATLRCQPQFGGVQSVIVCAAKTKAAAEAGAARMLLLRLLYAAAQYRRVDVLAAITRIEESA
jgi:hypothetical protein